MRNCAMFLSAVMLLITLIVLTTGSPREGVDTSVSAHSVVKRDGAYIDVTTYGPDVKDTNNVCQNIRIDCDLCSVGSMFQRPVGKDIMASFKVIKRGEVPVGVDPCSHTWIKAYNGDDNTTEIGSACGNEVPPTLKANGNAMFIVVSSKNHRHHPIYNVTECYVDAAPRPGDTWCSGEWDGNLTSSPGTIQSVNYPEDYPKNHICNWKITAPESLKIRFTFVGKFGIEGGDDRDCLWRGRLEIREGGEQAHGPDNVRKFCGKQNDRPESFTSKTNVAFVRFVTDGSTTASGFQLKYEFVEGSAAGLWSSAVLLFLSVAASASFGRSM